MKTFFILIFLSLFCSLALAHDSKEAFFTISETDTAIKIDGEFPWTLRNALLVHDPSLEDTKSKITFKKAFFDYIETSLILKDLNLNTLKLKEIREGTNNGHSHQTNYIFYFEKAKLSTITNTLMFNINKSQKNHHVITLNNKTKEFTTSKKNSSFNINQNFKIYYFWLILPIFILIIFWFFWKNKKF